MKEGTYNEDVNDNLNARQRTGTISRKDYWDIFPERKDSYLSDITAATTSEKRSRILLLLSELEKATVRLQTNCFWVREPSAIISAAFSISFLCVTAPSLQYSIWRRCATSNENLIESENQSLKADGSCSKGTSENSHINKRRGKDEFMPFMGIEHWTIAICDDDEIFLSRLEKQIRAELQQLNVVG